MTLDVAILGIGLLGPGLPDWQSGAARLRDPALREPASTQVPASARLPPNERRRAGPWVRAAFAVAEQAVEASALDASALATVFASSIAEASNGDALCEALATPDRLVSPTRFTNSVHNTAAGYWHIATGSRAASTSLAAHDLSFGAGLLEAAASCLAAAQPVLLVACDVPHDEPLHAKRPFIDVFAVALVVAPARRGALRLAIDLGADAAPATCRDGALEALRRGNPAARALPLLEAIACGARASIVLEGPSGSTLRVDLETA